MITFDSAWENSNVFARTLASADKPVVLIRDVIGRVSIAIDLPSGGQRIEALATKLREHAGQFTAPQPIFDLSDPYVAEVTINARDLVEPLDGASSGLRILDRGVVGSEWTAAGAGSPIPRIAFYGFKGGVGRSTATALAALHLADSGKRVLVIDLDLESPGVGDLLLGEQKPDFGIVDYLVEDAVSNDSPLTFVAESPYSSNGGVLVAPADGSARHGYRFLPKLNRVYATVPASGRQTHAQRFGDRLERAVDAAIRQAGDVDVVLLDSRAGLHDIAAVALTRLANHRLLFAVNSSQTRAGYRELFTTWRDALGGSNPGLFDSIRDSISMIAAMSPPSADEEGLYARLFADQYQTIFADTLYDNQKVGSEDAFSFGPDDSGAPHFPTTIPFQRELIGRDLAGSGDWYADRYIAVAYHNFYALIEEILERKRQSS